MLPFEGLDHASHQILGLGTASSCEGGHDYTGWNSYGVHNMNELTSV